MSTGSATLHCPCGEGHFEPRFQYDERPAGETVFPLDGEYNRRFDRCAACGHWLARHGYDLSVLYEGDYVANTYGDRMAATFERVMGLPPDRSDNHHRSLWVDGFMRARLGDRASKPTLLDIGAGLGVFPARMATLGWDCVALDPDPGAAEHLRIRAGVKSVCGDIFHVDIAALGTYDLVSLNKVIEHVPDPLAMLAWVRPLVASGGALYVEVPDGEAAAREGKDREEFFIEHYHAFSAASLSALAMRAGYDCLLMETVREPSTKFTLRAFLGPSPFAPNTSKE
ncbi:MAG TPA: class I SAM-dependent methyltransferase [Azospirillaceae bacterium]|nr:class I SAM-dependent methyltransferase [Azospirillaceae bacterium]